MKRTLVAAACGVLLTGVAQAATTTHAPHRRCPEDAVWMPAAHAQYSNGYWSRYVCIAGDDATKWWLQHH